MAQTTELTPVRQPQSEQEAALEKRRERAFDIALAVILALVFAALFAPFGEWAKDALAAPPCPNEALVHRLVIAPDARPRCLTVAADWPA